MENVEYRLKVIEKSIEDLGMRLNSLETTHQGDITNLRTELMNDFQKLNDEFKDLQREYEVSKSVIHEELKALRDMPALMQSLKETIVEIRSVLEVTQKDLTDVQVAIESEQERGKFDFMVWFRDSILPALLGFGAIYFILKTLGRI